MLVAKKRDRDRKRLRHDLRNVRDQRLPVVRQQMAKQDDESRIKSQRDQRIRSTNQQESNHLARRQNPPKRGKWAMCAGIGRSLGFEEGGFVAGQHTFYSSRNSRSAGTNSLPRSSLRIWLYRQRQNNMISSMRPDPTLSPRFLPPWSMRLILVALAVLTLLLNGYHPLAEDGGLYVAGVQLTLNPALFPHYTVFVSEHLHFSVFAPVLAFFVHLTHLSLAWILLFTDLFSLWLTFYAAHRILQRAVSSEAAQLAGLCLLAAFWTLPIAGTSLLLMDPYVTARSLSTPLSLLAVAFALDDRPTFLPLLWSALCLALAAAFHPLMAAYAFAFILILRLTRLRQRYVAYAILTLSALALAAILHTVAPTETPAIIAAEKSRYYWFLVPMAVV